MRALIPIGYSGYVPGVKSENVFGKTYGKTSLAASSNKILRGTDLPASEKYTTDFKSNFVNHAYTQHESVASQVGVHKGPCTYKRVRTATKVTV